MLTPPYEISVLIWPILQKLLNTLRPRHKCIFLNENVWIPIKMSLKFVSKGPINNIPALVQIMAWRRPGDKPLSETMMVRLLTHICVTRPQWVKRLKPTEQHSVDDENIHRYTKMFYNYIILFVRAITWKDVQIRYKFALKEGYP